MNFFFSHNNNPYCAPGYTLSPDGKSCYKYEDVAPDVLYVNYKLAISQNSVYGIYGTRIYEGDQTSNVATVLTTAYWNNVNSLIGDGPLNRCGVWIDSDGDGVKDSLQSGAKTTISHNFYNNGSPREIYIGIGADNEFTLTVNGVTIAYSITMFGARSHYTFKFWHLFKVTLQSGDNLINAIAVGDGSVNDAIGMIVYDNTAAQIQAATQDSDLNIVFSTQNLRGQGYNVTTCPDGYALEVNNGIYSCRKLLTDSVLY